MTDKECATFIVTRWMLGHTPEAIMVALVCAGRPLKKAQILAIIRAYCGASSENSTYNKGQRA